MMMNYLQLYFHTPWTVKKHQMGAAECKISGWAVGSDHLMIRKVPYFRNFLDSFCFLVDPIFSCLLRETSEVFLLSFRVLAHYCTGEKISEKNIQILRKFGWPENCLNLILNIILSILLFTLWLKKNNWTAFCNLEL